MDGESYKCYFEKSICQNIPKHSVIVIGNAPYHSKNTENYPTSKWRKQQFVDWLTEKNMTFSDKALRAELWTFVKSEREKFPDKVMETRGGGVMPYMCHTETCRRSGYTFWPSNPRQGVFFRA